MSIGGRKEQRRYPCARPVPAIQMQSMPSETEVAANMLWPWQLLPLCLISQLTQSQSRALLFQLPPYLFTTKGTCAVDDIKVDAHTENMFGGYTQPSQIVTNTCPIQEKGLMLRLRTYLIAAVRSIYLACKRV